MSDCWPESHFSNFGSEQVFHPLADPDLLCPEEKKDGGKRVADMGERLETWSAFLDEKVLESDLFCGIAFVLSLCFSLAAALLAAGLGWLTRDYALYGLWLWPLLIAAAAVVSSPATVLVVGMVSVVLGVVLPLTVESMADYLVAAPLTLAAMTGLGLLIAFRLRHLRTRLEARRVQLIAREESLTEQLRTQEAELEILRGEQEAWLEAAQTLAAPVLPVWEGVLALPFVGPFDKERAALARRSLLQAIDAHRAHTIILDVTGLAGMTRQVIEGLTGITQAVELTGCQVIIVGVRPSVAQRMAELGAKLGHAVMHRNLQAGVAYALERGGERQLGSGNVNTSPSSTLSSAEG